MRSRMMAESKYYDNEYKVQAIEFVKEIGQGEAVREVRISKNTIYEHFVNSFQRLILDFTICALRYPLT